MDDQRAVGHSGRGGSHLPKSGFAVPPGIFYIYLGYHSDLNIVLCRSRCMYSVLYKIISVRPSLLKLVAFHSEEDAGRCRSAMVPPSLG